jgi:PAS domain S-box-containing protein
MSQNTPAPPPDRPPDGVEAERDRLRAALADKERLAAALQESEQRLRDTLEAAEVGTWEWNIPDNHVQWSPNIERIFGMAPGTFAGTYEAWLALVHPEDRPAIQQKLAVTLESSAPYRAELRFLRPDGTVGWQQARGYVVPDTQGRPRLLRGIVFDVTARRAAEDALKMPARVLESMEEGVSLSDEEGVILYTNPAEDRMFGYARGELIGQHVSAQNAYPPEENRRIVAEVMAHLQREGTWVGEWANRKKDGTPFTTWSHITALVLDGKRHWVCVQADITAEVEAGRRAKELAASLRQSEARYRAFVGQSSEGIWRIELEEPVRVDMPPDAQIAAFYERAQLAECNDAMARMYGYERAEDLTGKRLGDLLVREDPRNHEYLTAFIASGHRLEGAESREVDRLGNQRVFQNSLVGVVEDGLLRRAWGTQRDITGQVEAREQAEAASRSKDEFLAMLGHELRNPLSPILTALELMKLRDDTAFKKERSVIERQVRHVVRLVDDLLDVSRMTRGKISLERRSVELADAVAAGVELASPLLEQRMHRLSVRVPRGLVVDGDLTRLGQVFANLLTNAAKYTPSGGNVTIVGEEVGTSARVSVRDDGMGIRPEILPRVFEMFVQERQARDRADGGLGLGLAIVRSLVTQHGGSVEARSEGPGRGSELVVEMPLSQGREARAADRVSEPELPRPDGWQVLVVDDNHDAAALLADALGAWGHVVRVAHDGPGALHALQAFTPDVAVLDIGLPVMDGYELARRIRADTALRGVRLLAVTGYGQAKDRADAAQAGFDAHLVKPVDLASLDAALSRLMARPARA